VNIVHLLSDRAAAAGDRPAIIDHSRATPRTVSFSALDSAAIRVAAQLRAAGLQPGDAVLLLQPVSAELYILFTAILRSGLVALFLDPSAGWKHIDQCGAIQPAKALVGCAQAHLLRVVSPALRRIPLKFTTDFPVPGARRLDLRPSAGLRGLIEDCPDDFPAIIRFTSGSTGPPKAALRTHGYLQAQQRVIARSFALQAGTLDLVTMPMFVLANLAAGVTSLIPHADLRSPGRIPPESLVREITAQRPHRLSAAPALLENLADYCLQHSLTLDSFQSIFTGGAPVFPRLLVKLQAMAPAAEIVAVYGSTEAEPIALLNQRSLTAEDHAQMAAGRGLLAGFPDEAIQLRILPEAGPGSGGWLTQAEFQSATLPAGQPGQIVVAGPHVQPHYLKDTATAETQLQVDGRTWHPTGDAGYLDERGRLWLLGRSQARIQDAHGILYPFQVEGLALENPHIRRAALLRHDERRVLAIEATHPIDLVALKTRLRDAAIDQVLVVPGIPVDRRHNSKIDYPALRRILSRS